MGLEGGDRQTILETIFKIDAGGGGGGGTNLYSPLQVQSVRRQTEQFSKLTAMMRGRGPRGTRTWAWYLN